jgi:hypothetical protein
LIFLLNSTTAINGDTLNVDSDISSTSSQTSSEHDPSLRTQMQPYNVSPSTNWPDESAIFYPTTSTTNNNNNNNNLVSPSIPTKDNRSNEPPTNNTVKNFDQLPEYKLFSSNGPSIHSILFGNNENTQQSHRPLINGIDHDLREIEKRLMGRLLLINCSFFISKIFSIY